MTDMDSPMQDADRIPEPQAPAAPLEPTTIPLLDGWIEGLMKCKQLTEQEVQRLCDKVRLAFLAFCGDAVLDYRS